MYGIWDVKSRDLDGLGCDVRRNDGNMSQHWWHLVEVVPARQVGVDQQLLNHFDELIFLENGDSEVRRTATTA